MSPLHVLAEQFGPSPFNGLAHSAMPNAPVMPAPGRSPLRRRIRHMAVILRRTGARVRSGLPLAPNAPTPVRAECSPS
jgi:hypothetical protein